MKTVKMVALAIIVVCFPIPLRGYGKPVVHSHKKSDHAIKSYFLFKEYPDLRAVPYFSLKAQNDAADQYGLSRATNRFDYDLLVRQQYLVPVPRRIACIEVGVGLSDWLLVLNPQALDYLEHKLAPAYCVPASGSTKPHPLLISSLTRTFDYQRLLTRRNQNAKAALGDGNPDRRSSHATGFSFDISGRNLDPKDKRLLADFLLKEKQSGNLVEAIFEVQQNHFHVMVHPETLAFAPALCLVVP